MNLKRFENKNILINPELTKIFIVYVIQNRYWETGKHRHQFTLLSKLAAAIVSYLQSWISLFLLNNKLFTGIDGESGHS